MLQLLAVALPFARAWWKAGLGAALTVAPAFLAGQCHGEGLGARKAKAAHAVAVAEALKTDGAAKEAAAAERLTDATQVANLKKDLTDAVAALPDNLPSARRVALACARLRRQGAELSRVPACSGPAGGGQAPAER